MSKYIFGPVHSRRYGMSLGLDLLTPKTCSFNCRFCQLGATAMTTLARKEYVPVDKLLAELQTWIDNGGRADWVTLGGSGEPTLHSRFGDILRWVKANTTFRTLILSNGSLFYDAEVRRDALAADAVKLSLHAWDQISFVNINRPHPSLKFDEIIAGYRQFSNVYQGELSLEVFVIPGVNDTVEKMSRVAELAATLHPARVVLNTAIRPPADASVAICPPDRLAELADCFTPAAAIPATGMPVAVADSAAKADKRKICELVWRHPSTPADVANACGITTEQALEILRALAAERQIKFWQHNGQWHAGPLT